MQKISEIYPVLVSNMQPKCSNCFHGNHNYPQPNNNNRSVPDNLPMLTFGKSKFTITKKREKGVINCCFRLLV